MAQICVDEVDDFYSSHVNTGRYSDRGYRTKIIIISSGSK